MNNKGVDQTAWMCWLICVFVVGMYIGLNKIFECKIVNMFLPISFNICFRCSKEPSHRDGSFEYPQNMFWLRNKKIIFLVRTL